MDELSHDNGNSFRVDKGTPASRVEMWNDIVCDQLVAVECTHISDPSKFSGVVERRRCADIDLCQVSAAGQRVVRSEKHLSRADSHCFLVNVQRSGYGIVRQDGRETKLAPGDLAIYSSDRQYELCFDEHFWQSVLIVPAAHFAEVIPNSDQLVARRVARSASTEVIANSIDLIRAGLTDSSQRSLQHLADAVLQLVASGLATLDDIGRLDRISTYLLAEIKRFIATQLDNRNLCPKTIADKFSVSVATVHRLFAAESTTLMASIWDKRLELCRRDLQALDKCVTIGEIAFRWGFSDIPHFSRSFKNRFGVTPSQFRENVR